MSAPPQARGSKYWVTIGGVTVLVLVATGLVAETVRKHKAETVTMDDPVALKARMPAYFFNAALGVYEFKGKEKEAFLARKPLDVGSDAPHISMADYRKRKVSVPDKKGRPTICIVACGCRPCSGFAGDLYQLQQSSGGRFNPITVVTTTQHDIFGHWAAQFLWKESMQMIWDENARLWRAMRAPGDDPLSLPFIWACDAEGRVRYAAQPKPGSQQWLFDAQKALGLKPVKLKPIEQLARPTFVLGE
jgi:hypothetical protein